MSITLRPKSLVQPSKLDMSALLNWLREDGVISAEDADTTTRRFAGGHSAQHPIVRLASAALLRQSDGKLLDAEAITEWLAKRCGLTYLRIDPLKTDVGRVAEIMSINYAERRRALPLNVGAHEVTIATCEPLDVGWVTEIEAHTRKSVKLVLVSPQRLASHSVMASASSSLPSR